MNKVKAILLGSVAVNVLLVGVMIGREVTHNPPPPPPHEKHWGDRDRFDRFPKSEAHKEMRQKLDGIFKQARERKEENRKSRDETLKLLTAETFDKQAYLASVQKMFDSQSEDKMSTATAVADMAENMTLEERKVLADMFRHPPHERDGKRHGKFGDREHRGKDRWRDDAGHDGPPPPPGDGPEGEPLPPE